MVQRNLLPPVVPWEMARLTMSRSDVPARAGRWRPWPRTPGSGEGAVTDYESPAPSAEQSVLPGLGTDPNLEATGVLRGGVTPVGARPPLRARLVAGCTGW